MFVRWLYLACLSLRECCKLLCHHTNRVVVVGYVVLHAAVFQAERDSERFALYARKAALDERAEEIRQQLKVRQVH